MAFFRCERLGGMRFVITEDKKEMFSSGIFLSLIKIKV